MAETVARPADLELTAAMVRLSHLVQHVFADVSRGHGLPPQQLQLLCMLMAGPVGMTRLSQLMHLERSSTTGLVDRVEKRHLVARESHRADRRACLVALTDEGRRLAVAAHGDVTARLESITEIVDPDDRARLASVATRILEEHDPSWTSDG